MEKVSDEGIKDSGLESGEGKSSSTNASDFSDLYASRDDSLNKDYSIKSVPLEINLEHVAPRQFEHTNYFVIDSLPHGKKGIDSNDFYSDLPEYLINNNVMKSCSGETGSIQEESLVSEETKKNTSNDENYLEGELTVRKDFKDGDVEVNDASPKIPDKTFFSKKKILIRSAYLNKIKKYLRGLKLRKRSFKYKSKVKRGTKRKNGRRAEARLAARRQARVEAREIRLRELERQQKEQEENADKVFDMSYASENILRSSRVAPVTTLMNPRERPISNVNNYHSSRRSSEDSLEDGSYCIRDIKHELKELDEKFRKAMVANAQLDNEKSELTYQVELLKDRLEDLEETHAQLLKENREKCREHEQLKRVAVKLKEDLNFYKSQTEERDKLIADYGLVIVGGEGEEGTSERALVSIETAEFLQNAGSGSLDVRLKKFADEKNELLDEIRHLKLELEEERSKKKSDSRGGYGPLTNGPLDEETSKILSEYRFKLQKAEQDVSTLQANVARLESQVIRYKSAAESSEKAEDELKIEKRKLQRENRESIARIEELETANSHLQRRMDKLKNAKSTLLKEL